MMAEHGCTYFQRCAEGVIHSRENDVCGVTMSFIFSTGQAKPIPGKLTYDLWNTSPMLCRPT